MLQMKLCGDLVLRTKCEPIDRITPELLSTMAQMVEMMRAQNGVGLAAPQIGENVRIFVLDVSTNEEPLNPIVFINPKIIKKSGACVSHEGCLSFPEAFTDVRRYANVMVKALDSNGRSFVMEAKEGTLLARCIQHEFDHLDGVLFIDHAINRFEAEEVLSKNNLPPLQVEKMVEEPELAKAVDELKEKEVNK